MRSMKGGNETPKTLNHLLKGIKMKVKDLFNVAESVGLCPAANLMYSEDYNVALVTTRTYDGTGKGIPNTTSLYNFSFGDAELLATETWVEMREFWLSLEGDNGPANRVQVFPHTATAELNNICEQYGIPVPQEMVALFETIFA